jgi:crossover junction endodeoxyribonuclease RuvC
VRRYIGIDPGITGGIAAIDVNGGAVMQLVCAQATPTLPGMRRKKLVPDYDVRAMYTLVAELVESQPEGGCIAILERAGARPGQGVSSTWRTGEGFGLWKGLLAAFAIQVVYVTPNVWKQRANLIHADKRASVLRAKDTFPQLARLKASEHGIAEAALIAFTQIAA